MARKYSRDNRGRFASSGSGGATARGGRLKTASGKKREGQTMKAAGAGGAGVMKGKVKRDPGAMAKAGKAKTPAAARIQGPKRTGGTFSRLSGGKMSAGAGKRGKARAARVEAMAGMRKMLGRVKPGRSAEPLSTGGTLAARASLKRARAKAGAGAGPAQRGAVTRANTYAKASKARNTQALKGGERAGVMKGKVKRDPAALSKRAAAKPMVKPAGVRRAGRTISEAKAARIVSRIDALRPGQRKVAGSARRTQNAIRSYSKASDFVLSPAKRSIKRGKPLSVTESVRRAVANARKSARR